MKTLFIPALCLCLATVAFSQDPTLTARSKVAEAEAIVNGTHGGNAVLLTAVAMNNMGGLPVVADARSGLSHLWLYGFYTPSDRQMVTVLAMEHPTLGSFVVEAQADPIEEGMDTTGLPAAWLDSDAAAAGWRSNGLQAYFDARPSAETFAMVMGSDPNRGKLWSALVTDYIDSLTCMIDAVSGSLVECLVSTGIGNPMAAAGFDVGPVYPNPVAIGTVPSIEVNSVRGGPTRITVYDVQGRQLGIAADQELAAGSHTLAIPPALIPRAGVYFLSVEHGSRIHTTRLVVAP